MNKSFICNYNDLVDSINVIIFLDGDGDFDFLFGFLRPSIFIYYKIYIIYL